MSTALAVAGTLMVAIRWVLLFSMDINVEVFNAAMERLLARGDRARALKLCEAVAKAVYLAATGALLQASMEQSAEDKEWAVRDALERAWDRAVAVQEPRMRRLAWLAPLGFAATAVAAVVAYLQGQHLPAVYVSNALAAFLWLASISRRRGLRRKLALGRSFLIPRLTAHVLAPPSQVAATADAQPVADIQTSPATETKGTKAASGRSGIVISLFVAVCLVAVGLRLSASFPSGTVTGEIGSTGAPHGAFSFRPADCFHGDDLGFEGVWLVSKVEGKWGGHAGFKGGLKISRGEAGWGATLESPIGCRGYKCPQRDIAKRDCKQLDLQVEETGWLGRREGHANVDCVFPEGGTLRAQLSFAGCAQLMRSDGD